MRAPAFALFVAAFVASAFAQDFSKVEIRTTRLAENVYMLAGAGGNLGVSVGEDAVFVIDDQYAPLSERITAAIAAISPKPVKFILNTHWHPDHTGGNESFAKAGAVIFAHENVRKRLTAEQFVSAINLRAPPAPRAALPVVTFAAETTFHLNGEEMRAIHMPRAHTDGDVVVHFLRSDVVHMGDIYWSGMYPFIDAETGGSVEGVIAAVDKVLSVVSDKTRIIPGHGALSNKAELKAYRDMLAAVSTRVRDLVRQGRTAEEIAAANVTADFDERWNKGGMKGPKFVDLLVRDMIRRAP